jgi:hypothetical protein
MSFQPLETSRDQGEPINLFLFTYGTDAGAHLAFTDAEQVVAHPTLGIEFRPIPIARGNISTTGTLDKTAFEVRTPHDSALADLFKVYPPAFTVNLRVFQGHANDPDSDFLAIWVGRVLSCGKEGSEAIFKCEPISTTMRAPGLRRHYQYGCPHELYGPQCRASQSAATIQTAVMRVDGFASLTLYDGWYGANDPLKFRNGLVSWQSPAGLEKRTILGIAGGVSLRLNGSVSGLGPGSAISVVKGCNHQMDDCAGVHGNIHNFGGQSWIPLKNPIGLVNNFY